MVGQTSDDFITFGTPAAETGTATYAVPFACQFKLNHILGVSEFTSLYDQYKIMGCRVKMIPLSNVAQVQNTASLPTLVTVRDYDDAVVPSSTTAGVNEIYQRQDCRERRFGSTVQLGIRPRVAAQVYNSVTTSGYSNVKAPWLDINSPAVPHYGIKGFIRNLNLSATSATTAIRIDCSFVVGFKDPR